MELWQLKQLQSIPLEQKIYRTQRKIREYYEHFYGAVYVSFSGGKDSTVLLNIARGMYKDIEAVFFNTGVEYSSILKYVETWDNVTTIKPKMSFPDVIKKYGYPIISKDVSLTLQKLREQNLSDKYRKYLMCGDERGKFGMLPHKWRPLIDAPFRISDKCCDILKKRPANLFVKKSGKVPIIGTLATESRRRQLTYIKQGCNAFRNAKSISNPLGFWTEQDILQYITEKNIKIASCYGDILKQTQIDGDLGIYYLTGEQRTGCAYCLFGAHRDNFCRIQMLKEKYPKMYNFAMALGYEKVINTIKSCCTRGVRDETNRNGDG